MGEEEEKGGNILKKKDEDVIVSKVLYQEDVDKMINKIRSQIKSTEDSKKLIGKKRPKPDDETNENDVGYDIK